MGTVSEQQMLLKIDVVGEFDKLLGWCNHATEAGVNGHGRPHATSSAASSSRPERSLSKAEIFIKYS